MVDPSNWRLRITWLDENNAEISDIRGYNVRNDAIEAINEVLVDASYYPEGTTLLTVKFYEAGVAE